MITFYNLLLCLLWAFIIMNLPGLSYKKRSLFFLIIVGFQLFLINCFKDYNLLLDTPYYAEGYEHVRKYGYDIKYGTGMKYSEPGWILLNVILSQINSNPRFLFGIVGGIIVYGHIKTYYKYSSMPWLSVYLFLCFMFNQSLFVIRQHLAIALCLLAIPYIINRKLIPFLIIIAIATSIHNTAAIFLISYWLYSLDVNKKFIVMGLCASILSYFILSSVLMSFVTGNDLYSSYADGGTTNLTGFSISLCIIFLALYAIPLRRMKGELKLMFILYSLALCINIGGLGVSFTARLNMYFTVSSTLLIPYAVSYLPNTVKPFVVATIMLAYVALFLANPLEELRFLL